MCDCTEAPSCADLVTDVAAGDVVCRRCGVVVQSHIFNEEMEYYGEGAGPRAGPAPSWLLPHEPTVVDNVPNRNRVLSNPDPHSTTRKLFEAIDVLGRGFSTDVCDTAKLLCRDLSSKRCMRSSSWHLYAACSLYLATKMHGRGIGRSKKEIAAMFAAHGVSEQGLTVISKQFKDALHAKPYASRLFSGLDVSDLINRCVDRLDLSKPATNEIKKAAHELARRVSKRECEGKTPCSVCSGILAVVMQDTGIPFVKKKLADACCVSAATMDKMSRAVVEWTLP